jgi:uncharacterized membrane protein
MRRLVPLAALVLFGCPQLPRPDGGSGDGGVGEVCMVTAPTACTQTQLGWAQIEPIIVAHCTICHDGSQPQWPLRTYSDVADWADIVRGDVVGCTMPPPESGSAMTNAERLLILEWIKCGFPR